MLRLTILSLFVLLHGVEGTQFVFNAMGCDSPASISLSEVSCGEDSEVCDFGDVLSAEGTLNLSTDLPSQTMCVTTKACFMGIQLSLTCKEYAAEIDVCNDLGLTSTGYQSCPYAGPYTLSANVKLPGKGGLNLGSSEYRRFCLLP